MFSSGIEMVALFYFNSPFGYMRCFWKLRFRALKNELQYILPLTVLIMKEKDSNSHPYYLVDIRPPPAAGFAVMLMISF